MGWGGAVPLLGVACRNKDERYLRPPNIFVAVLLSTGNRSNSVVYDVGYCLPGPYGVR